MPHPMQGEKPSQLPKGTTSVITPLDRFKKEFSEVLQGCVEEIKKDYPELFTLEKTQRGFDFSSFKDLYGEKCSLQKSSIATEPCIWFGADNNRMHLSQDMVRNLLPYLTKFVETGEIA